MLDWTQQTINTVQVLDPLSYPGAEYFNFFFTLVLVFGLIGFSLQILFRVVSRS